MFRLVELVFVFMDDSRSKYGLDQIYSVTYINVEDSNRFDG